MLTLFEFDICFFCHMSVLPAPDSVSLPDATGTNSIAQLSLSFTAVPLPLLLLEAPEVVLTIATMMMLRNHRLEAKTVLTSSRIVRL